ncbi:hypothetical protein HK099_002970, partial [Clydaea vesicula]
MKDSVKLENFSELVIDETKQKKCERVVVLAVDQSIHSKNAVNWAIKNLIHPETDQVILLYVRPDLRGGILSEERSKKDAEELIKGYSSILSERNIMFKGYVVVGDAREMIVKKVEEFKGDILVMGSRGVGFLNRVILGSTSDYCVHNCNCS